MMTDRFKTNHEAQTAVLEADRDFVLSGFPLYLKKGVGLNLYAECQSFSGLIIGKGHNSYRGYWIQIDENQIIPWRYETEAQAGTPIPHGLTIREYLMVTVCFGNDGKPQVILSTLGGGFQTKLLEETFELCGEAFLRGAQRMMNVKFSAAAADIRRDVWIFGDSYLGIWDTRIGGQLKKMGFFDGLLLEGLAGAGSPLMYRELENLLEMGAPKEILWMLGMNDTAAVFQTHVEKVKHLCESRGIGLCIYRIPPVPGKENEEKSRIVIQSGLPYVDAWKAVGGRLDGTWYEGYLSGDLVHPTELGAKAIAARILVDFPSIFTAL